MTLLIGSLQLGFLYSIMVLGIYISFRILNIPDLTTEGSFTFGLAASSILTAAGHPLLGLVGALIAGALAAKRLVNWEKFCEYLNGTANRADA